MADSTGQVTLLMNAGIDAFTNLYDIQLIFPGIISSLYYGDASGNSYSVRAMGFQPPELSLMTYNSDYKAVQLTKQAPKIQGERIFTIEFRLDANYYLYYDLLQMKHIWHDPSGEGNVQPGSLADTSPQAPGVSAGTDNRYGQVNVGAYAVTTPLDGFSNPADITNVTFPGAQWKFYDVVCNKVGTPNYQRAGADAVTVSAEFIFGRYSEPYSSGPGPLSLPNNIPTLTGESA